MFDKNFLSKVSRGEGQAVSLAPQVYEILEVQDKLDGDDVLCRDHGPQARSGQQHGG